MLKLKQVNGREGTEGVYNLTLSDNLQISGPSNIHCIPYPTLIWLVFTDLSTKMMCFFRVATGEHCVGFNVENLGIFEFATGDALLFVEHLR